DLTTSQKEPTLFRTAVPDDVLVTYLTGFLAQRQLDAKATGWRVAVVARDDAYGQSVGNTLVASLGAAGLAPTLFPYNPNQVVFDTLAGQVAASKPDQVVVVSYEEGANLAGSLLRAKVDPSKMIGLDSFFAPRLATQATVGQPNLLDGFTIVGTGGDKAFINRLITDDPNGQVAYAAQAYDCAIVLALASAEVESKKASTIASAVQDVTAGGIKCTTYADCLAKLEAGENIDYDGPSGRIAIDAHGDPTSVRFTTAKLAGGNITGIANSDIDIADMKRVREAWGSANFTTQLQQALRFLGFYTGPINGVWTTETSDALKAFQTSAGLEPTGFYDAATDAALRAALGQYGTLLSSSVKDIQQLLTGLGFYTGPIDGIWNPEVTAAIKAFQKGLGVPETGVIDAATLRAVFERGLNTPTTTVPSATTTAPATTVPTTTQAPTTTTTEPKPNIFDSLKADPQYSTFVELLDAAGFHGQFQLVGPYTVFAPTNDAFAKLAADTFDKVKADPSLLRALIAYHIVEGKYPVAKIADGQLTISGAPLKVTGTAAAGDLKVNGATIAHPDVEASNGIVQGIDAVFTLPFTPPAAP
ncbi:MAG: peptidoglycan-binding protein, partial [Actinomycetota bacterium]